MNTDLTRRATVRELVAAFEAAERDVRAAFASLVATEQRLNAAFGIDSNYRIRIDASSGHYNDHFDRPNETIARMTRAAWQSIVERLELRRFMSIKRWEEVQKQLERDELPPITEANVLAFAERHLAAAREMLTEAVQEVFEWLRPRKGTRTGDLKTNTEMEVGERAIVGYVIERGWAGGFRVNHHRRQNLIALENVFNGLAGNGTVCKGYQSLLETAIDAAKDGEGETDLFAFRACLNGNLHLRFKRLDLLARFNMIAGGKNLRPAETEEERLRREIAKAKAENERLRRQKPAAA